MVTEAVRELLGILEKGEAGEKSDGQPEDQRSRFSALEHYGVLHQGSISGVRKNGPRRLLGRKDTVLITLLKVEG